jgi:AraC-like DNA-binding protein/mannose-6-phosphate isomerase-like protein (cupin superfamily)
MVLVFFKWAKMTAVKDQSFPSGDRGPGMLNAPGIEEPHARRVEWLEQVRGPVVPLGTDYPAEYVIPSHRHSKAQLLYAVSGVLVVSTDHGRWLVPLNHALLVPAGVVHAVTMWGPVSARSIHVAAAVLDGLPQVCRVVGLSDLMRSLIAEAVKIPSDGPLTCRDDLIMALIIEEILRLPERPLGLPLPAEPRLAALCRAFLEAPSPRTTIDDWADSMAMSRRAFTRTFRRETGLSLSAWRQQASLFAALPRLSGGDSVTNVALDLGYETAAAFTTMFKRMLGAPPSRYMRDGTAGT